MMDGFKAYRYYRALRLHFTQPTFDVFKNRGRVKGSEAKFLQRNDHHLFHRIARKYPQDRECIMYIASNMMYGNFNVVYDEEGAAANYKKFIRRRQSTTHMFREDLQTLINGRCDYTFDNNTVPDVLSYMMSDKITFETVVILDKLDGLVRKVEQNSHASLLLGDVLLRIKKAHGFVKFDSYKVMSHYLNFLEEVKGHVYG